METVPMIVVARSFYNDLFVARWCIERSTEPRYSAAITRQKQTEIGTSHRAIVAQNPINCDTMLSLNGYLEEGVYRKI